MDNNLLCKINMDCVPAESCLTGWLKPDCLQPDFHPPPLKNRLEEYLRSEGGKEVSSFHTRFCCVRKSISKVPTSA